MGNRRIIFAQGGTSKLSSCLLGAVLMTTHYPQLFTNYHSVMMVKGLEVKFSETSMCNVPSRNTVKLSFNDVIQLI